MSLVREGQRRVPDPVKVRHRILELDDTSREGGGKGWLQLAIPQQPREVA